MILTTVFSRVFRLVYLFLTCGGQKGRREQIDEQEIERNNMKFAEDSDEGAIDSYSDDFIMDLKLNPLKSFYNRSNRELKNMEVKMLEMKDEMIIKKKEFNDIKKKHGHHSDEEIAKWEEFNALTHRYVTVH
jgi:hypothetical protein